MLARTNKRKYFFVRNDDVRGDLDNELVEIAEVFISRSVPIALAIEPKNVSKKVVNWLMKIKEDNPDIIELIQHGYNHNVDKKFYNSEFGGNRGLIDQMNDIYHGKVLMDMYFDHSWNKIFSFPYGKFNEETLEALQMLEYYGITSNVKCELKNRVFDSIGRIVGLNFIMGRKISYHMSKRSHFNLKEISVSINLIKRYINQFEAQHYNYEEIKTKICIAEKFTNVIGLLLHHRYHTNQIKLIDDIITYCIKENYTFLKLEDLFEKI